MYPQRLHFLQHFFLVFTFLLLSQVSLQHVQTPHTFFLFYIMPKRFGNSDLKSSEISKSKHWPPCIEYAFEIRAAVERKYTAPGREKNSWKYSSMPATEKLMLFTNSALVQNWETKREAFAKNHESSLRWMKTAIALLCLGPVWRVGNCWKVGLTPQYVLHRVLA